MNWDSILTQRQAKYPTENFVRFVARNYYCDAWGRAQIKFLDLGCGAGANSKYLKAEGFDVVSLDSSPNSAATIIVDMLKWEWPINEFDCVLDNNTLCHVEKPPLDEIQASLKEGGKLYSICPTSETWRGHLKGKGFCRCATKKDIAKLYFGFSNIKVGRACYPDDCHTVSSWVIEATR